MKRIIRVMVGVLAAATLCLGLGWGVLQLGKLYLSVIGHHTNIVDNQSAAEQNTEKQLVALPSLEIYYLQLGVFQDLANAKQAANELQLNGIKAVVLNGTPNKVAEGYFGQLAAAQGERKLIQSSQGIEKSLTVKALSFKAAPGDAQQLGKLLSGCQSLLAQVAKVCKSADPAKLSAKDLQALNGLASALGKEFEQSIPQLSATQSKIPGKQVLSAMGPEIVNIRQNITELVQARTRANYNRLQESTLSLVNLYSQYLDILRQTSIN